MCIETVDLTRRTRHWRHVKVRPFPAPICWGTASQLHQGSLFTNISLRQQARKTAWGLIRTDVPLFQGLIDSHIKDHQRIKHCQTMLPFLLHAYDLRALTTAAPALVIRQPLQTLYLLMNNSKKSVKTSEFMSEVPPLIVTRLKESAKVCVSTGPSRTKMNQVPGVWRKSKDILRNGLDLPAGPTSRTKYQVPGV